MIIIFFNLQCVCPFAWFKNKYLEFNLNRTIMRIILDFSTSIFVIALFSLILIVAMAALSIGICIHCLMKLTTTGKKSK